MRKKKHTNKYADEKINLNEEGKKSACQNIKKINLLNRLVT
jgi:hypothetical protein